MSERTVFHDPSGRRRRWLLRLTAVASGLTLIVCIVFVLSLIFLPAFPPSPTVPENVRRGLGPGIPKLSERAQRMRHFLFSRAASGARSPARWRRTRQ